jgi:hypothetical protein
MSESTTCPDCGVANGYHLLICKSQQSDPPKDAKPDYEQRAEIFAKEFERTRQDKPKCKATGPHHGDPCNGGRIQSPNAQFTQDCPACKGIGLPPTVTNAAGGKQLDPKPGSGDMWVSVLCDMLARRQLGIERYGTVVQANNGRDALQDAYDEALDLAVYLRQAIEERRIEREGK